MTTGDSGEASWTCKCARAAAWIAAVISPAVAGRAACQRASESFQEMVYQQHLDGINRSCLGRRKGIGAATVQRYFLRHLQRRARQDHAPVCPKVLGIDEHFFTRKKGYATTFCDLKNHRIYDVTLGRSEAALESYFLGLGGQRTGPGRLHGSGERLPLASSGNNFPKR